MKGKWYVNVNAPNEISHLYTDGRKRVSSGTNDKRIANERASQIVDKIMDEFAAKYAELDPFIEACRPYLIKAGFDPSEWYTKGSITAKFVGEETSWFYSTGKTQFEKDGVTVDFSVEERELENPIDIAVGLGRRGFALPRQAFDLLPTEVQQELNILASDEGGSASALFKEA